MLKVGNHHEKNCQPDGQRGEKILVNERHAGLMRTGQQIMAERADENSAGIAADKEAVTRYLMAWKSENNKGTGAERCDNGRMPPVINELENSLNHQRRQKTLSGIPEFVFPEILINPEYLCLFEPVLHDVPPVFQVPMRNAPSKRIVAPFSIGFSTICRASAPYSAGVPSRFGKGIRLTSDS
jgi:hypothetical protein